MYSCGTKRTLKKVLHIGNTEQISKDFTFREENPSGKRKEDTKKKNSM